MIIQIPIENSVNKYKKFDSVFFKINIDCIDYISTI